MTEDLQTIIETIAVGNSLKVTAIDYATGVEGTIICPTNTNKLQREQLAIKKLQYILSKKKNIKDANVRENQRNNDGNLY